MSALPLELLTGKKSAKKERLSVRSKRQDTESRRQAIRDKVSVTSGTGSSLFICGNYFCGCMRDLWVYA